jgi:hypothetical protein
MTHVKMSAVDARRNVRVHIASRQMNLLGTKLIEKHVYVKIMIGCTGICIMLRCAIYQKQDELVDMLCKGATPSSIARHKADLAALLKEKLQLLSGETNVGTKPVPLQPEAMVCI